jgi:plasmid segregation protein ParM
MPEKTPLQTDNLLVAVDDGYAQVKVWTPNLRHLAPANTRAGSGALMSLDGKATSSSYMTDDTLYTASDLVVAEDSRLTGYHQSPLNRVAIHNALHQAGFVGQVKLSVGLPVGEFYRHGKKNETAAKEKRESLLKAVTPASGVAPIEIVGLRIYPQAIAAWADHCLDENNVIKADMNAALAVVDVGGRTTDIAVMINQAVDHNRSGTILDGVLNIRDHVTKVIAEKFGIDDKQPARTLDDAVRTGKVQLWGKTHDISSELTLAARELLEKVTRYTTQQIGRGADLSAVVFVGGGAAFLKPLFDRFPNAVVHDDPEFANARGLWKFARNREIREAALAKLEDTKVA